MLTVNTRTVQAFDDLLLLKRGGLVIYMGSLGERSVDLVEYFQGIQGVPRIREGLNPATWMLEISTLTQEERIGVDFADCYRESELFRYPYRNDMHLMPCVGL